MAKIFFLSLGCPKNEIDCEMMASRVVNAGYEVVLDDTEADVAVVNTCAFIQSAKEEGIENILDLAWLKENRHLKGIIVTGCMAQRYFEDIKESMPEVDAVLSLGEEVKICDAIKKVLDGEKMFSHSEPEKLLISGDRVVTKEYSAYLKIAEGCDNRCSYCAIPMIRGKFRSREMDDILNEAKDLRSLGVRELNIVAQDTTRYGLDIYGKYALSDLVNRLASDEFGFKWIRLMYCYPDKITDELISAIKNNKNVCKYIDIPIQHISDPVLKRMNRHGGSEVIKDAVRRLKESIPGIVLRTTVMVGFPGESNEDFKLLSEFVKEGNFERLGAFSYSKEEDTPAFDFDGQVSEKKKKSRLDSIMLNQQKISADFQKRFVGSEIEVLVEGYDAVSEMYFGRSEFHAPEIDGEIYFSSKEKLKEGTFCNVLIEEAMEYDLVGKKV